MKNAPKLQIGSHVHVTDEFLEQIKIGNHEVFGYTEGMPLYGVVKKIEEKRFYSESGEAWDRRLVTFSNNGKTGKLKDIFLECGSKRFTKNLKLVRENPDVVPTNSARPSLKLHVTKSEKGEM